MKRFYILAMGLTGVLLAASCSDETNKDNEPVVQQPIQLSFKGVQSDSNADTKSYLDDATVYWNAEDLINVFTTTNQSYKFKTNEDGATVTFVGTVLSEDVIYFGLYPYNESATSSYNSSTKVITYNTTIPSSQEALANSFAKGANITVAQTTNNDMAFHFKNVCGLIKFRITSNAETLLFTKAVLEGNNSENIAGAIRIVYDSDAEVSSTNPSVDDIGTGTAITLNAPAGSYLLKDTDYYIAVPPRTFLKGYKITFYKGETLGPVWTVTGESATVIRSKILNANTYTYTAVTSYTITASPDNVSNGTVSKSPDGGTYLEGTMVTLTATPNDDKGFTQWSDGNTDNPRTVLVDSDKNLTASFANAYSITASPDPVSDGFVSISPAPNGANGKFIYGTSVTLTATPAEGKVFTEWSDGNTDNPRTFNVDSNKNLTASFANAYSITATPNNADYGTISISPAPNVPGGKYVYGTTVTLTATPAEGKVFTEWSDGNTDNPRTFNVDSNKNLTASFANAP